MNIDMAKKEVMDIEIEICDLEAQIARKKLRMKHLLEFLASTKIGLGMIWA